ncbi:MAG TPA: AraC family transcriptional regulator [Polyangiaceae bacterium]|nr:AraC family transcriptional regulator [Polyangiaceae bacterium]
MQNAFTEHDAIVPIDFPHLLIETAVAFGASRSDLIEGTGVAPETFELPDARISYAQFQRLEENALRLTKNPALGLYYGERAHVVHLGAVALVAMSSADVQSALIAVLEHQRAFLPGWVFEFRVDGPIGRIALREALPRGDLRVFATEAVAVGFHRVCRQILGREPPLLELHAAYPRPAHHAEYEKFFRVPVLFDQPVSEAVFDARVLQDRMEGSDPAMAARAARYVAAERIQASGNASIVDDVRRVIGGYRRTRPDLGDVARELGTSARSLRRNLHENGASFQALLDEARRARAEDFIRQTNLRVEQISTELGFTDVRSFRRAFKRWTGRTPMEVRNDGDKA